MSIFYGHFYVGLGWWGVVVLLGCGGCVGDGEVEGLGGVGGVWGGMLMFNPPLYFDK